MLTIEKLGNLIRSNRPDIFADLDIEVDRIPFRFNANGDSATLIFNRTSHALTLFRKFISYADNPAEWIERLNAALADLDFTIYLQSRHFGVIGSKAKPYLPRILSGFAKIISRRGKSS